MKEVCPHCKTRRGHKADCPFFQSESPAAGDYSIAAYRRFLHGKTAASPDMGIPIAPEEINPWLKPHAKVAVEWAVRGGRRALFESFGMAKTSQQLEILRIITTRMSGRGLIVAPLGVRQEFQNDAAHLGINLRFIRRIEEADANGIYLTNYETIRDGKLNPALFTAASLDEASILRGFGGTKTFREFMRLFETVPYRFVATATPDPNEYIELLAYAAFLGIMDVSQAKTRFFKRDSTKADKLTIHSHKQEEWNCWLGTWALFLDKPSDLGPDFSDEGYDLPPIEIITHEIPVEHKDVTPERDGQGRMFREAKHGVIDAAREKRDTITERVAEMRRILDAEPQKHFILWHDLENERHAIMKAVPDARQVYGGQRATDAKLEELETNLADFAAGRAQYIAGKPQMLGSGVNWQYHCSDAIYVGIGFKFNDWIQSIHRIHRFLQPHPVRIHLIYAESERLVYQSLMEKWERHKQQAAKMSALIRQFGLSQTALSNAMARAMGCERREHSGRDYRLINSDCVEELQTWEPNSVHLVLTSIPFSTQYEYSPNYSDFGHTDGNAHFWQQMDFLTPQLFRVLQPGRWCCIHVKDRIVPGGITGLGFQTVYPFHVDAIRHYVKHGFAYMGMKTIVTDVVRENNQTYRLGWTEQCKDATKMGVGMPEYLLIFRRPPTDTINSYADMPVVKQKKRWVPDEQRPIDGADGLTELIPAHWENPEGYSRARWQIDAHGFMRSNGNRPLIPRDLDGVAHSTIFKLFRRYTLEHLYDFENHVRLGEHLEQKGILPVTFMLLQPQSWNPEVWTDITRMRTLNGAQSAKGKEAHLCPLQFDVADRVIKQLSQPGEAILDPFAGLGTVPMKAVQHGRRGMGIELSASYWYDSITYCKEAQEKRDTPTLFALMEEQDEIGWYEEYETCACLSLFVPHLEELPGKCPIHKTKAKQAYRDVRLPGMH